MPVGLPGCGSSKLADLVVSNLAMIYHSGCRGCHSCYFCTNKCFGISGAQTAQVQLGCCVAKSGSVGQVRFCLDAVLCSAWICDFQ